MTPRTSSSEPRPRHRQEADTIRKARFFQVVNQARASNKSMSQMFKQKDIARETGYRWLRQRSEIGARRSEKIRKRRSRKVTEQQLQRLIDPSTNPVRDQILKCQRIYHQLSYSLRTLQRANANRKPRILMSRRPGVKKISSANKKARVQYGNDYQFETVKSF